MTNNEIETLLAAHANYPGSNCGAKFQNIPIEFLDDVRAYFKEKNVRIRVRYRGPRNNPLDRRPFSNRQQDCLKRFANRFHVYDPLLLY